MNFKITGRNLNLGSWEREFAVKKLNKIEKMLSEIVDAEIIISKEKINFVVDINVNSKLAFINAKEKGKNLKSTLKAAFDSVIKQAKKEKEKIKEGKRKREKEEVFEKEYGKEEKPSEKPVMYYSDNYTMKPISINEAISFLENSDDPVFAFKNIDTGWFSVVFKRGENEIGIIEFKG